MQETQFDSWVRKIPWRRDRLPIPVLMGFPGGSGGKECTCNAKTWFDPWVGKIPWRRAWQPTPVFLPGEFQLQSMGPHTTERLSSTAQPCPPPGDLPDSGIERTSHVSCIGRRVVYHYRRLGRPTKPVYHNYEACALEPRSCNRWAHLLRLLKPAVLWSLCSARREACTPQLESRPR